MTVIFLTLITPLIIDMTPEGQQAANILFVFTAIGVVGSVGDKLLIAAAQWLRSNLRETDLTARLGGDEFVVVLQDIESAKAPTPVRPFNRA